MDDPDLSPSTERILFRLMRFLYQISLFFYSFFIRVASPFNPKAKAWIVGRKNPGWSKLDTENRRVVWFHCASLGEFDIGLPLMEAWKKEHPSDFLLVTFFSPSVMQNYHKRQHPADAVDYLPLDTPKNALKFVKAVRPATVFFVKYEFWAYHLFAAKKCGAKIYSVNTIFRKRQLYFKPYGEFYRKILRTFDHFFVQNESSGKLLESIGIEYFTLVGDLRFDRVFQNKMRIAPIPIIDNWLAGEKAFVVGSSWPKDEAVVCGLLHAPIFSGKAIIAPHEISEEHLRQIEKQLKLKSIRYTDAEQLKTISPDVRVLLLNTIGHLSNTFQYGEMAYIGGGFSGKLHNILEPAVFGLPVFFGPNHKKFPEATLFLENGFGFNVHDSNDLLVKWQEVNAKNREINTQLLRFMKEQVGIAQQIMFKIHLLKN